MVFIIPIIFGLIIGTQLIDNSNNDPEKEVQDSCNLRYENNNRYIKEYVIPSKCSAPVAITIDSEGIVWFIENNHSKISSYNPEEDSFNEVIISEVYSDIQSWSMIAVDDDIWFTDHRNNFIWRYMKSENIFEHYILPTEDAYPVQIINFEDIINCLYQILWHQHFDI